MLSSNYEVGSMGVDAGLYMYDVVVKKFTFTFTILPPDEFICTNGRPKGILSQGYYVRGIKSALHAGNPAEVKRNVFVLWFYLWC